MGSSAATAAIESLFCAPPEPTGHSTREPVCLATKGGITRRAKDEARGLFQLVGQHGQTVRSVREHIIIPPHTARDLFRFIEEHPAEGAWVFGAIEFRNRVLREFDVLTSAAEHAERIAAAEAEAARRAAAEVPALPLLHDLVVQMTA